MLVLALLCALLASCANRVRLPDLQRVEIGSIPPERQIHSDDALRPTDIVEFIPLTNAPAGTVVTVTAGNCDPLGNVDKCVIFLRTHAAYNNETMAIGSKAALSVAALMCVTEVTVTRTGSDMPAGGSSKSVLPQQWGSCPQFSNDRRIGKRDLHTLLAPFKSLVDVRITRQPPARVMPGDAVEIIQRYQLGVGNDEPTARPFVTTALSTILDEGGRLTVPAPDGAANPPCSRADLSCARQRAMYSTASHSGLSVRLWELETCQANTPTLKDAELCLTAGWSTDQLKKLPKDEQARIVDICVRSLDIDLYQREWRGRGNWENVSLRLEPRQHWTLVDQDGGTHLMNYAVDRSLHQELELAHRRIYGRPLMAPWFATKAHVVILPSPHRCRDERRALWMVHNFRATGVSVLERATILPGDTVYFNYSAPSAD